MVYQEGHSSMHKRRFPIHQIQFKRTENRFSSIDTKTLKTVRTNTHETVSAYLYKKQTHQRYGFQLLKRDGCSGVFFSEVSPHGQLRNSEIKPGMQIVSIGNQACPATMEGVIMLLAALPFGWFKIVAVHNETIGEILDTRDDREDVEAASGQFIAQARAETTNTQYKPFGPCPERDNRFLVSPKIQGKRMEVEKGRVKSSKISESSVGTGYHSIPCPVRENGFLIRPKIQGRRLGMEKGRVKSSKLSESSVGTGYRSIRVSPEIRRHRKKGKAQSNLSKRPKAKHGSHFPEPSHALAQISGAFLSFFSCSAEI